MQLFALIRDTKGGIAYPYLKKVVTNYSTFEKELSDNSVYTAEELWPRLKEDGGKFDLTIILVEKERQPYRVMFHKGRG